MAILSVKHKIQKFVYQELRFHAKCGFNILKDCSRNAKCVKCNLFLNQKFIIIKYQVRRFVQIGMLEYWNIGIFSITYKNIETLYDPSN